MPTAELKNTNRIFGLDLMRAVATLMVLFAHCIWIFPGETGMFSQLLALSGFLGVEIFFVLSGFLIGRILFRLYTEDEFNIASIRYFLKRRWFRTFPNYFLILGVNFLIAAIIGYRVDFWYSYLVFLQNFASPMLAFFPESWSLSVEEFAYIILPVVLLVAAFLAKQRYRKGVFLVTTLLLIFMCVIAKCIYHFHTPNPSLPQWNVALKAVVVYRLDAIFIGVLFSWIYSMYPKFWYTTRMIWFLIGMIMMAFFTVGVGILHLTIDRFPFFWNVIYLPAASISIAFFLPMLSEWKSEKSFVRTPVTFISLISYSIYLLHYSVVLQAMKHLVNTEKLNTAMVMVFTVSYLAITIFLSYLLYRFYERPMMAKRDRNIPKASFNSKVA